MSARDEILGRIRRLPVPVIPRDYDVSGSHITEPMALLAERLRDYAATVFTCASDDLDATLAGITRGWRVAIAAQAPFAVPGAVRDDPPLSHTQLDEVDAVLTGCAAACAETGTIALDAGPDQGRRALTLIPDRHVCVVHAHQVVRSVPELVRRLDPARPLTFVSGPSATSDIELNRVEGVHGPRNLIVVLVDPVGSASGRR